MKVSQLILCLAFSAIIPEISANTVEINGKLNISDPAEISVVDFKGTVWPTNVNHLDSTYYINITVEKPEIMTFFINFRKGEGEKNQTYVPVLVNPENDIININIEERDGFPVFSAEEPNEKAFLDFTDFIVGNLRGGVAEQYTDIMTQNIRAKTQELQPSVSDPLVKDYLELWGESTIWLQNRLKNHKLRRQGKDSIGSDYALTDINVDYLISNRATKYFPEFVAMVSREKATGDNLVERVDNLRKNLPEGELRDYIEDRIIVQYINSNMGKEAPEDIIAQLDIVGKDNPGYESWVNAVKNYHSYLMRGDEAPEDVLYSADGDEFRLSDFKGKYVFIDFWASWCVYCVKELPALEKIKEEFADSGIEFIGISLDENMDNWKKALEKYGLSSNQFVVSSPEFAQKLGLSAIPRYIIYDKEGKMLYPEAPRPRQYEKLTELLKSLV